MKANESLPVPSYLLTIKKKNLEGGGTGMLIGEGRWRFLMKILLTCSQSSSLRAHRGI